MKLKSVYNPSTCCMDTLERKECPRCRGFGGVFPEDDGADKCFLCNGHGEVWRSDATGYTFALWARNGQFW